MSERGALAMPDGEVRDARPRRKGFARFALERVLWTVPTFFGISLLVFIVVHAAPGDPALSLGESAGADGSLESADVLAARAEFRAEHLLDQPLWKQYLHYLGPFDLSARGHPWFGGDGAHPYGGILAFDFGHEFRRPSIAVSDELERRLAVTIPLSLAALALSLALALPLGVACARTRGSVLDRGLGAVFLALFSVPVFWGALLLVLVFGANGWGILPVLGLHDKDASSLSGAANAWDVARHAVLPVLALAYGGVAYYARLMRGSMIEVLGSDFVRAARAKGLSEARTLACHAIPNAIFPFLTLLGAWLPAVVGGSVLVEAVFQIPGMGRYAYEGFLERDYNVVMATTLVSAALTLAGLVLSDLAYAWLDPRVRHA